MNKPIDYPLEPNSSDSGSETAPSDITYAVLRDRVDAKKPVTDEMIRTAQIKLDTAQGGAEKTAGIQGKLKLKKFRNRFRAN